MMSRHIIRFFAIASFLIATTTNADAQKSYKFHHRLDSMLSVKYWRADIDTNYITRPKTKWTVLGRFNVSGARIEAEGKHEDRYFATEMTADYKSTVSVGVSYIGLALNFAINPAKMLGKYNDYELNFRSYSPQFGFDIAYQDAHNFKGWQEVRGVRENITTSEDMFKLRTLNVNAYYAFNKRRFSYPAAFIHSYIQRRSAGSFFLAVSAQGQHGKVKADIYSTGEREEQMNFKMTNIGIGGGYGYNYVPSRNWMIHLSILPTFIVHSNTSLTFNDTHVPLHYHFPEGIVTCRNAIVKQIGDNKFAGFAAVYNFTSIGDKDKLNVRNQKWFTRLYFGIRL